MLAVDAFTEALSRWGAYKALCTKIKHMNKRCQQSPTMASSPVFAVLTCPGDITATSRQYHE